MSGRRLACLLVPRVVVLLSGLLLCSCAMRTCCYVVAGELTHAQSFGDWHLVRVNPDGSVVVTEADREVALAPPGSRTPGKPYVLQSSYEAQTCSLRHSWCERSFVWPWSEETP